ncbi:glycosyltransferase family protein [Methylorubrum extorquens]|uniref:glycosyltransferase family protein n=1 Tax=Methylorubrum extorquens TaxID=408 RepID=UPI001EE5F9F3|nr:glycosyltransferase [Methylorubrum extorquens]MCG5247830.1 glycosyltransferase [Methylorubrum extorquens]
MLNIPKRITAFFHRRAAISRLSPSAEQVFDILREHPESVGFNSNSYLQSNPDVARAGIDPLLHLVMHGNHEGREASPGFSARWYADMNGLAEKNANEALLHMISARSGSTRRRVAFFGYAWNSKWRLDAYMSEIVTTLADLGLDVDVFIGNQFTRTGGPAGFLDDMDRSDLGDFLKERAYDFAISFNNSLIMPETVSALRCTVVSIIVDSLSHLFNHMASGPYEAFGLPIHAAPIYTSLIDDMKNNLGPSIAATFLPAATRIGYCDLGASGDPIAISWIASLVGDHHLDSLMLRIRELPGGLKAVGQCLSDIEETGEIRFDDASQAAARAISQWAGWDYSFLEMQLQNVATNTARLSVVENLLPLGLEVFGNERWHTAFAVSSAAVRAYRSGANLRRHADLRAIYDRSKISINYPQAQAATGMQYRILDVLASRSLLITKHVPDSDMNRLFGAGSPIVTFEDMDDLRTKCAYYLDNEHERRDRVKECNSLVARGFSFQERVRQYLSLSNAALAGTLATHPERGVMTLVGVGMVRDWITRRGRWSA